MFTGIIEEIGRVNNIQKGKSSASITLDCIKVLEDSKIGDSIAVNGVCLTINEKGSNWFRADVMPETISKTNLDLLSKGSIVNLERALCLSDRLGGHLVSGHVDDTGVIESIKDDENAVWFTIKAGENILRYIVTKGSVAIDGISLTVAAVGDNSFKVSLIPHTRSLTTLGSKKVGDIVNLECDIIGKYTEKLLGIKPGLQNSKSNISIDFLRENGFA